MPCPDHDQCIDAALLRAERLCLARGARLTAIRRTVLTEIWADHEATKAYDLIHRLSRDGVPVKPPTIYRALDFLLAHGLVHRIESLNAYVGCDHPQTSHEAILLICRQCGAIREQADEHVSTGIRDLADRQQFAIRHQTIELLGLCTNCHGPATD